jgi:ABC-2 type transport system permease protein
VFFVLVFHVDKAKGAAGHFYGAQLLGSIVLFTMFGEATGNAVRSVVERENLVRKIQFPRLAIPISVVLLAFFNLALNLVVVLVFAVIEGVHPMLSWLELPLLILGLAAFAGGLAMLLSALFVRYRDVEPIWEVVLQALFYAAPIFYTINVVREKTHAAWIPDAIMFNPFAAVLQQARHAVIDPSHEDPVSVFGDPLLVLVPIGITVAVLVVGFMVFNRLAPHIAEEL